MRNLLLQEGLPADIPKIAVMFQKNNARADRGSHALFFDEEPRAGSGVVRIDQLHFLAECRKRRLNQVLSVLSLSLGFLSVLLCC